MSRVSDSDVEVTLRRGGGGGAVGDRCSVTLGSAGTLDNKRE